MFCLGSFFILYILFHVWLDGGFLAGPGHPSPSLSPLFSLLFNLNSSSYSFSLRSTLYTLALATQLFTRSIRCLRQADEAGTHFYAVKVELHNSQAPVPPEKPTTAWVMVHNSLIARVPTLDNLLPLS